MPPFEIERCGLAARLPAGVPFDARQGRKGTEKIREFGELPCCRQPSGQDSACCLHAQYANHAAGDTAAQKERAGMAGPPSSRRM